MNIATAGHVDHGKTSLVRALTLVDTDRLAEEKRRGMSIDLGFAYADFGADAPVGFIDVPGHERFVRNMLAGQSGWRRQRPRWRSCSRRAHFTTRRSFLWSAPTALACRRCANA